MKRFILLLTMAIFTIMAVSSCESERDREPEPKIKFVVIDSSPEQGNKPIITPEVVRLSHKAGDQVMWVITDPDKNFLIKFDKNGCPFRENEFSNNRDISGRTMESPGNKPQIYRYSVKVDGLDPLDPIIIVWN
jgi:hypothetical protein